MKWNRLLDGPTIEEKVVALRLDAKLAATTLHHLGLAMPSSIPYGLLPFTVNDM